MDDEDITTMSTTADPDYDSSPDVAIDGSVADETTDAKNTETPSKGLLWQIYVTLRGFIRAPLGLLRRYLIPLLAFMFVFGVAVFLIL
jgi:hypothetical protein